MSYEDRMFSDIKARTKNGLRISISQAKWLLEQVETAYQKGYEQGKKNSPKLIESGQLELPPIDFD